jgi:hypothetical protein
MTDREAVIKKITGIIEYVWSQPVGETWNERIATHIAETIPSLVELLTAKNQNHGDAVSMDMVCEQMAIDTSEYTRRMVWAIFAAAGSNIGISERAKEAAKYADQCMVEYDHRFKKTVKVTRNATRSWYASTKEKQLWILKCTKCGRIGEYMVEGEQMISCCQACGYDFLVEEGLENMR